MAVVATTIAALQVRPAQATGEARPCRTPCLSANVPREPAEPPPAEKAERADEGPSKPRPVIRTRTQPAASAPPPVQREAAVSKPAPSKRCSEINMRAAVGEPLSDQDMKTLRSQC